MYKSPLTLLLASLILVCLSALAGLAAASGSLGSTPPATWDISGNFKEDPLGGYAGSGGTITVKNDGPGTIVVGTYDDEHHGEAHRHIKAGETKNLQVRAGETVEIEMAEGYKGEGEDNHAKGTAVFTPNGTPGTSVTIH
jgi:predicted RNA-binding protein with TRAM domain